MSHYSKALSHMKGYDSAITAIKAAITMLEEASDELNRINGIESCENLKSDVVKKIEELQGKISQILNGKERILNTADGIDRKEAAQRRREEEERKRELERQKMNKMGNI